MMLLKCIDYRMKISNSTIFWLGVLSIIQFSIACVLPAITLGFFILLFVVLLLLICSEDFNDKELTIFALCILPLFIIASIFYILISISKFAWKFIGSHIIRRGEYLFNLLKKFNSKINNIGSKSTRNS